MLKRFLIFCLMLSGSSSLKAEQQTEPQPKPQAELKVVEIPLSPPLDLPGAEISGMTWCGDKLVLLPQYPRRLTSDKKSRFYTLSKQDIVDYLDGKSTATLQVKPISVDEQNLRKKISIFDGYEAIACVDDTVWLAIESVNLLGIYYSYLVKGKLNWSDESATITIQANSLLSLESQSKMRNMGDEAIFIHRNHVISIHEVNDPKATEQANVQILNTDNFKQSKIPFPHIPFRITDTTKLDKNGRFWAINYKYSGDKFSRKSLDPIAEKYGEGDSHKQYYNVERLLEFQFSEDQITLVDRAPLQLKMQQQEGRNWEGLVRLGERGFLLATDKHPKTILGFVATPN